MKQQFGVCGKSRAPTHNGYLEREEISTGLNMGDSEPVGTSEEAWEKFVQNKMRTSGLDEKAIQEEYELRIFTDEAFAGEERFAIYSSDNVVSDGWQEDSNNPGKWWYLENGAKVKGWKTIGEYKYFFNRATYYMHHGWLTEGGSKYFMGRQGLPETGRMYTDGWMNDGEGGGTAAAPLWYYFNTSTGKMLHGWLTYKREKYYLGVPGDASSGLMYDKGWMEESGKWYYIGSDGIMKTGWLTLGSGTFYLGIDGQMRTGWQTISGSRYYFNSNGQMQTGWQTISQRIYFFRDDGSMVTGNYTIGAYTYLFDRNGVCVNRNPPLIIDNQAHYMLVANDVQIEGMRAIDSQVMQINTMGYRVSCSRASLDSQEVYAQLPYDEIVFLHGHGAPGVTYITNQDSTTHLYYTHNFDDPNHYKDGWLNDPLSFNVDDYFLGTLRNLKFVYFLSCYSAATEHHLGEYYRIDKSCLDTVMEKGAVCGLGYRFQVSGAEFYGKILTEKLAEGKSIALAIDAANREYGILNAPITREVSGSIEYQSPHDARNQVLQGDAFLVLQNSVNSLQQDVVNISNENLKNQLSLSAYGNTLNCEDEYITFTICNNGSKREWYDSDGRLKTVENMNFNLSGSLKTTEEIVAIAQKYLQKLCPNTHFSIVSVDPSAIGNQLYFSATDSNLLSVIISIGKNGMISWCTFYYNDSVLVSESEEKYFEQLTDNYISSNYPDIHQSRYTFDYLCVDGKLLAKAFITLEDGDGLTTLEELWIGDKK